MLSHPWIAVLKKIPTEHHSQLMLTTVGGMELMIQQVLVGEGECFIFKGRMSGSQDTGRIFFVPFDQVDFLCTVTPVSEEIFREWFGGVVAAPVEESTNGQANSGRKLDARQSALLDQVRSRTRGS